MSVRCQIVSGRCLLVSGRFHIVLGRCLMVSKKSISCCQEGDNLCQEVLDGGQQIFLVETQKFLFLPYLQYLNAIFVKDMHWLGP